MNPGSNEQDASAEDFASTISPEQTDRRITQLLSAWRNGDQNALNELIPLVYNQLRSIARNYASTPGGTVTGTVLVHEAFARLARSGSAGFEDRDHFFAVAAKTMRNLVLEFHKNRNRKKRGGDYVVIVPEDIDQLAGARSPDPEGLNECIEKLFEYDQGKAEIIDMKYFVGLTTEQIAQARGKAVATVNRELRFAKTWLRRCLEGDGFDET